MILNKLHFCVYYIGKMFDTPKSLNRDTMSHIELEWIINYYGYLLDNSEHDWITPWHHYADKIIGYFERKQIPE